MSRIISVPYQLVLNVETFSTMPLPLDNTRVRISKTAFVLHNHIDLAAAEKSYMDSGRTIRGKRDDGKQISLVFDYWFDPSRFIVVRVPIDFPRHSRRLTFIQEHYADGDIVNKYTSKAHMQAGPSALAVLGPPVPQVF